MAFRAQVIVIACAFFPFFPHLSFAWNIVPPSFEGACNCHPRGKVSFQDTSETSLSGPAIFLMSCQVSLLKECDHPNVIRLLRVL